MKDAERWWAVVAGAAGLSCLAAGALVAKVPRVDHPIDEAMKDLARRRSGVLIGSVMSIAGAALLLWPLAFVAAARRGADQWPSLAAFSMATWVFGFGFLALGSLLVVGVVWRVDEPPGPELARTFLDISHLSVWSVSAPVGAVSTVATTIVGVQADLFGPWVVAAAVLKVATVLIEIAGTGHQRGWNAGGWALGMSGYATVTWFALVIIAIAR